MLLFRNISKNIILSNFKNINNSSNINRYYSNNNNNIKMDENDIKELISNYNSIKQRVEDSANKSNNKNVKLVAVSKTKPIEMIKILYEQGHRHFGENYIQELMTKSEELKELKDIKWHYIGSIQSNKAKLFGKVSNLYAIETIEKKEILDKLAKSLDQLYTSGEKVESEHTKINVMIQINTSGEESKSGCKPDDCVNLVKHCITDSLCSKRLNFLGLMTIGNPNATDDQPDFKCLNKCKSQISESLSIPLNSIELSMGMSHDFEAAIEHGSSSVRVGSAIFGERDYSKK